MSTNKDWITSRRIKKQYFLSFYHSLDKTLFKKEYENPGLVLFRTGLGIQTIEGLTGMGDEQGTQVLAVGEVRRIDTRRVAVAQVERLANLLRDTGRQGDVDARAFDAVR
jgi:hypothetical protein